MTRNNLGGLGRQLPARFGRSRLYDNERPLDGARDVQRSTDGQVLPFVVKYMPLLRIEKQPALLIAQPRIVDKAVSEAGDHLVELERSPVALVVFDVIV